MQEKVGSLIKAWGRRNIEGVFCAGTDQAHRLILERIPQNATIGFSGSQTLEQLEIIEMLQSRGNKVFNQYDPSMSREESLRARRIGSQADYFLSSANAIAETGELVFFSAYGHRIAGIAAAGHVIIVAGTNKIVPTLEKALERARTYATPLNCKRLKWNTPCRDTGVCKSADCFAPEYARMCCQALVIEAEVSTGRLTVVIVGEELGF